MKNLKERGDHVRKTNNSSFDSDLESIKQALYSVNRHAKTAISKHELYDLKYQTLQKLIKIGHAKKMCLEYSTRSGKAQQSTVVLVKVGMKNEGEPLYFHMIPEKDDFKSLKHTGTVITQGLHNPKSTMSLTLAKKLLQEFIGKESKKANTQKPRKPTLNKKIFTSSFLDGGSRSRHR